MNLERILNILRRSKPVFRSAGDIEEKVMERIFSMEERKEPKQGIIDFLFGWVYIGWLRKSLIAASLGLVVVFVYQQSVILKRINDLNRQAVFIESQVITQSSNSPDDFLYRLAGSRFSPWNTMISDREIKQMMKSYGELEEKYTDLIKIIGENPEVMKYLDDKLTERNKKRFKL